MDVGETKTFRFRVTRRKKPSELWVTVFMDDLDSPDVALHGDDALIREFDSSVN